MPELFPPVRGPTPRARGQRLHLDEDTADLGVRLGDTLLDAVHDGVDLLGGQPGVN